jgi:hypothetical protein
MNEIRNNIICENRKSIQTVSNILIFIFTIKVNGNLNEKSTKIYLGKK